MSMLTGGSRQIIVKSGETFQSDVLVTHLLVLEDAIVEVDSYSWKKFDGSKAPANYITSTLPQGLVIPIDAKSVKCVSGAVFLW